MWNAITAAAPASNASRNTSRGSTTVVSIDPSARLNEAIWDEGGLLDDCDLVVSSATPPLILRAYKALLRS